MVSFPFGLPAAIRLLVALQGAQLVFGDASNSTAPIKPTSSPSTTDSPSALVGDCAASCKVFAHTTQWYWVSLQITTTITAATVLYVIGKDGTTRTSTVYADLPDGYTRPLLNDKGTQIASFSWTAAGGAVSSTTIAFPTQFNTFPAGYTWEGTLSTVDKAGKSICAPASSAYVPFSPYATPTQHNVVDSLQGKDGYVYSLAMESVGGPAYQSINPDDAAPKLCSTPGFVAPAAAQQTAQLLTITSTSHEGSTSSETPKPNSKVPSSTKPESQVTSMSTSKSVKKTVIGGTTYHPYAPAIVHTEKTDTGGLITGPSTTDSVSQTLIDGETWTPYTPTSTSDTSTTTTFTPMPPPIVLNGTTYHATPVATAPGTTTMGYIIVGATLAPGSTITLGSGILAQTVVLRTKASVTQLEVDGKTSTLPTVTKPTYKETVTPTPAPDIVVIGDKTITENTKSQFIIDGKTLTHGATITLGSGSSATIIALSTDSKGNNIIIQGSNIATTDSKGSTIISMVSKTSTITHAQGTAKSSGSNGAASSSTMGVGDYINSGLGGGMGLVILSGTATRTATGSSTAKATGASSGAVRLGGEVRALVMSCMLVFLL